MLAPGAPRTAFSDLQDVVKTLRTRGLRLSTPRRLVLKALFEAAGPVSAERIAETQNLELTSVYRNLESLELHGVARHVHLGHGPGLYVLIGSGEHEYLYCDRCGAVRALSPEELDPVRQDVRKRYGYEVRFTHFAIVGTCPTCSRKNSPKEASQHSTHEHDERTKRKHAHPEPQHAHEHSHGDYVHAHPHHHKKGVKQQHAHSH